MDQPPPEEPQGGRKRTRSEKRRARERITFRLLPAERIQVESYAEAAEQSLASYIRSRLLTASATPARRRPAIDQIILTRVLAELKRIGNNINQLARHLNMGNLLEAGELLGLQQRHDMAIAAVLHALGRGPGGE